MPALDIADIVQALVPEQYLAFIGSGPGAADQADGNVPGHFIHPVPEFVLGNVFQDRIQ